MKWPINCGMLVTEKLELLQALQKIQNYLLKLKWINGFWILTMGYMRPVLYESFQKIPLAYKKIYQWSQRNEEFVKRASFTLIAILAVHDKKASDDTFEKFLPLIIKESCDGRNYVKKAVNWGLRQIGKRNSQLNKKAIETAEKIQKIDNKAAKWIAKDALKELTSEKIKERIKG